MSSNGLQLVLQCILMLMSNNALEYELSYEDKLALPRFKANCFLGSFIQKYLLTYRFFYFYFKEQGILV